MITLEFKLEPKVYISVLDKYYVDQVWASHFLKETFPALWLVLTVIKRFDGNQTDRNGIQNNSAAECIKFVASLIFNMNTLL